jgi:pimeloyl-ACP methyl ester carboxylesterase
MPDGSSGTPLGSREEMVRHRIRRLALGLLVAAPAEAAHAFQSDAPIVEQPAECEARVAYDRDRTMTGYLLPTAAGPKTCIPFSTVGKRPPVDYRGDFYVDEFADERLRARWAECKKDKKCHERVGEQIHSRRPPNKEYRADDPQHIYLLGKLPQDETGDIDLARVRRPAFFAAAPWSEAFAVLDARTSTVEFTAPRDPYERIHEGMKGDVRLRGWYIGGDGVDDGVGGKRRALIVMTPGGGGRIAAITHPDDRLYRIKDDGETKINKFPSDRSGGTGQQMWRELARTFNAAGFDILLYDRRGVGISTGFNDINTLQQGRDILAMIASLRSGEGLRALSPDGKEQRGRAAAAALRGADPAPGVPVLLFGNSRGTMASGWAMTMNFDKNCTYDLPKIRCTRAVGDRNIKGAVLMAEFTSGPGFVMDKPSEEDEERGLGRDRPYFIGGNAVENNLVFFPSSAILGGIDKWPAAFFARGLWDYAASLQGTVESYRRVQGPKELIVVRAPHPYEVWPEQEQARARERMVAFATGVIQGKDAIPGGRPWRDMKELVATSSDVWEPSTKPTVLP